MNTAEDDFTVPACYNRAKMRRAPALLVVCLLAGSAFAAPVRRVAAPAKLALADSTVENSLSCDISLTPAATLLLPYFDVAIEQSVDSAANTIFTVVNTSRLPQIARVTIWTDQGFPAIWFNVFLTGYGVQSISLYDVLARGVLPQASNGLTPGSRSAANAANPHFVNTDSCSGTGGQLDATSLAAVRAMMTTGERQGSSCIVGSSHANASGYLTIDLVNSCSSISPLEPAYYSTVLLFDNVLTGDYERIAPEKETGNFAGGSPLVHIKAVPEGGTATTYSTDLPYTFYDRFTSLNSRRVDRRQPLPSAFAARFIQGGTGDFFTDFMIWREGTSSMTKGCPTANAALPVAAAVRFDENENPTASAATSSSFPVAASVSTRSTVFPPLSGVSLSGWMLLNLDTRSLLAANGNVRPSQNWVVVHLAAEGRYGVDYDATALANGCGVTQAGNSEAARVQGTNP
jgi:hypothetical protein